MSVLSTTTPAMASRLSERGAGIGRRRRATAPTAQRAPASSSALPTDITRGSHSSGSPSATSPTPLPNAARLSRDGAARAVAATRYPSVPAAAKQRISAGRLSQIMDRKSGEATHDPQSG